MHFEIVVCLNVLHDLFAQIPYNQHHFGNSHGNQDIQNMPKNGLASHVDQGLRYSVGLGTKS